MALRSGYKGIKKLASGLKWNRPGILAADDTALAKVFFPRSEQAVLGAKNIWNSNDVTAWGQFEYSNGEISNTVTDTRGQLSFLIQGRKNGSFVEILVSENVATTGKKEFVLNIPDNLDINQLYIGHNGATTNLLFLYPFTKKGRYVVSFNATGIDPTTVGGIVLTEFMVSLDGGEYALPAMTNRELTDFVNTYMSGSGAWYAGDCDSLPNGVTAIGSSATNKPFNWGIILTMYEKDVTAAQGVQIGISMTSDVLCVRHKNEGTWSAWKQATLSAMS